MSESLTYEQWYDKHNIDKYYVDADGILISDKWCLGGTYGNCWDSGLRSVDADEQPEFDELDKLLEEVCPNITLTLYKKIKRECCSIERKGQSDYYGGYREYGYHKCDLKKVYEIIKNIQ